MARDVLIGVLMLDWSQDAPQKVLAMYAKFTFKVLSVAFAVANLVACAAAPADGEATVEPNFGTLSQSMKSSGEIVFDGYRSGHLLADEGFHLYSFEGRGDSEVTVQFVEDSLSPHLVPNLFLVGPINDGSFPEVGRALMDEGQSSVSAKLPKSGEYLVVVGAQRGQGIYSLALWCDSEDCSMPPRVD